MTQATVSRIAVMQNRTASILIFMDGCIIVTNDDFKDDFQKGGRAFDYLLVLMQITNFANHIRYYHLKQ